MYVKSPGFQILALNFKEHYLGQRALTAHWPHPGDPGPVSLGPACREEGDGRRKDRQWRQDQASGGAASVLRGVLMLTLYIKYKLNLEWVTLTVAMPGIKVNASGR